MEKWNMMDDKQCCFVNYHCMSRCATWEQVCKTQTTPRIWTSGRPCRSLKLFKLVRLSLHVIWHFLNIRTILETWSFIFERWSAGLFFQHTKPPTGLYWDKEDHDCNVLILPLKYTPFQKHISCLSIAFSYCNYEHWSRWVRQHSKLLISMIHWERIDIRNR